MIGNLLAENGDAVSFVVSGAIAGVVIMAGFYVLTMMLYFHMRTRHPYAKMTSEIKIIVIAFLVSFAFKLAYVYTDGANATKWNGFWGGLGDIFYALYLTVGGLTFEGFPGLIEHPLLNALYIGSSFYAGLVVLSVFTAKVGYEIYSRIRIVFLAIFSKSDGRDLYIFTSLTKDSLTLAKDIARFYEEENAGGERDGEALQSTGKGSKKGKKGKRFTVIFTGTSLPPFDRKNPLCRDVVAHGFLYYHLYKKDSDTPQRKCRKNEKYSLLRRLGFKVSNNPMLTESGREILQLMEWNKKSVSYSLRLNGDTSKRKACRKLRNWNEGLTMGERIKERLSLPSGNSEQVKPSARENPFEKHKNAYACSNGEIGRFARIHIFSFHVDESFNGDEGKNGSEVFSDIKKTVRELCSDKKVCRPFITYHVLSDNEIDYIYYENHLSKKIKEWYDRFRREDTKITKDDVVKCFRIQVVNEAYLAGRTLSDQRNELFKKEINMDNSSCKGELSPFLRDIGWRPDSERAVDNAERTVGRTSPEEAAPVNKVGGGVIKNAPEVNANAVAVQKDSQEAEEKGSYGSEGGAKDSAEPFKTDPPLVYRVLALGFGKTGREAVNSIYTNTVYVDRRGRPSRFIVDVYDREAGELAGKYSSSHPLALCSDKNYGQNEYDGRMTLVRQIVDQYFPELTDRNKEEKTAELLPKIEFPCFRFHAETCFNLQMQKKLDDSTGYREREKSGGQNQPLLRYNSYVIALGNDDSNIEMANNLIDDIIREYDEAETGKSIREDNIQLVYVHIRSKNNIGRLHWTEQDKKMIPSLKVIAFGDSKSMYSVPYILDEKGGMSFNGGYHFYTEALDRNDYSDFNRLRDFICGGTEERNDGKSAEKKTEILRTGERSIPFMYRYDDRWANHRCEQYFDWLDLGLFQKASSIAAYTFRLRHVSQFLQEEDRIVFTEENLKQACLIEHERWLRFHIVHGWTFLNHRKQSGKEERSEYQERYFRRHREHECMVPWDLLDEENRKNDLTNVAVSCTYYSEFHHLKMPETEESPAENAAPVEDVGEGSDKAFYDDPERCSEMVRKLFDEGFQWDETE